MRRRFVPIALCSPLFFAADNAQSAGPIPNLSGPWGRTTLDYELPPSGLGPVQNKAHILERLVGD
jgi:hypothetical protein